MIFFWVVRKKTHVKNGKFQDFFHFLSFKVEIFFLLKEISLDEKMTITEKLRNGRTSKRVWSFSEILDVGGRIDW